MYVQLPSGPVRCVLRVPAAEGERVAADLDDLRAAEPVVVPEAAPAPAAPAVRGVGEHDLPAKRRGCRSTYRRPAPARPSPCSPSSGSPGLEFHSLHGAGCCTSVTTYASVPFWNTWAPTPAMFVDGVVPLSVVSAAFAIGRTRISRGGHVVAPPVARELGDRRALRLRVDDVARERELRVTTWARPGSRSRRRRAPRR